MKELDEKNRIEGICRFYDISRCYGFIDDKNGNTYHVSCKTLNNCKIVRLQKGEMVSFIPRESKRGLYAVYVEMIKGDVKNDTPL